MKKLLFIISLFFSVAAIGQTDEYYRTVDWKFYPDSVIQLTDSTWKIRAVPYDFSDPGSINRIVGNYVVDFIGHRFAVIDSTSTTITVKDIYHTRQAPQTKQIARCYRSVDNSDGYFVGSVDYSPLDESSKWKLNGADNELLYREVYKRPIYIGIVNEPTITKNGDGTITIASDGDLVFNEQADGKAKNKLVSNVSGTTITPTDNSVSYIYADYNNGTPFYTFDSENLILFSDATKIPIVRVTRLGTQMHFEEPGEFGVQLANKIMYKNVAVNTFQRQSGLTLSTAATRISTISSGVAWFAIKYYNLSENKAGTSGNLYQYYLSGGNWLSTAVTNYDADYYSDGTNRQTLSNNKWVAKYFYRDVGDDNEAYYIHGNQYNTSAEALAETLPFAPNIITAHSIYVGKIVIQKGSINGTAYPRQWEGAIQSATSSNHADLTNLGWTVSNHTDGANKIAAFDATGAATTLDTVTNLASQYDLVGRVTGPASSTDNAIARFDGTTGKLIQNSGVIIDDNNRIYSKEILINKSNFPSNEVDGIYVSATYSGSESVIRGIKTESHYSGTYAQTGIESSSYIEGSNNQGHANVIQSWLYNTSSGTTTYTSNYYASKTLTSGAITDHYGYIYNSGSLGSATIGNDYAFYSQGNSVSLFEGGLIISPVKLSTTNRRQRLSSYDDTYKISSGILNAGIGIYSTIAAAPNNIGAIAFGSARTGLVSSYYENAFIAGGNDAANQYGGYLQFNTTSSGGGGEIASENYERMRIASTGNILINTTTDNLADKLQVNGSILGTTAKLINLSDGYIPYHVSDASGLANSIIRQTTGAKMTLNGTTTGGWYINGGNSTGTGGGYTLYQTDATNKFFVGTETAAIGGTSGGGIAYVYGNFPFKVYTNNVNRLTIDATGGTFTGFIQGTTGKFTNLTDTYIPKHTSDATGLENSNIFFSGNIARYGTANTFSNDRDIPDKAYVDAIAAGNMAKLPVDAATTANITLSGTQTIDGYAVTAGMRVLVKNQSTASQNGVYTVASGAWTRTTYLDTWAELYKAYVAVLNGTVNGGASYVCTIASTGTLETDPITWVLYNAPTNIVVNAPLSKTGNTISLSYDANTLAVASNALKVKDNTFQPLASVLTNTTASFTTALETKLNGIEDSAEVNVNADWNAVSGDAQILNKPTLLSQFTNDLGNYGGFLTTETDPIFASDSSKILHWSDTLNVTKGIASQYDLTTGLATKQSTLTTGNLTENVTGLQFDATRQVIGGSAQLSLTSGYVIPTTTEQTNWNSAYSNRITSLTTTGNSGVATLVSNILNVPNYTLAGLGGVPTTRTITINGTSQDLSANRSWSVGTVTNVVTGLGLSGGPITNTGTIAIDTSSTVVLSRQRAANTYQPKGTYQTGTESYISNLSLSGNTLTSTGVGSAFNSTVGNIANTTSANTFNQNQTVTSTSTANGFRVQDAGSLLLSTVGTDYGLFYMRDGHPYFINGDFGSTEIQLDAGSGTVTSVGLSAPTGFSVTGSPITTSGTLGLSFAAGYSLPTTASQTNWNTAYTHSQNDTDLSPANEIQSAISMGGLRVDGSNNFGLWAGNTSALTPTTSYYIFGSSGLGSTDAGTFTVQQLINTIPNATTSVKGLASFNSSNFTVSSGAVSITNSGHSHNAATAPGTYTALVSNGGLGASGSSLYLSNTNASSTAPLLTDYMWASPSASTTVKSFTLQTLKDLLGVNNGGWTDGGTYITNTTPTDEVRIGSSSDLGVYLLQVSGNGKFTGSATAAVLYSETWVDADFGMTSNEIATPSTPNAGTGQFFAGSDSKAHYQNDSGVDFDLTNVNEPLRTISSTGTTQLSATDKIILVTGAGATITYPTVTSGKVYTIRNTTSSAITVPTYNVLGPASSTSVAAYGCVTVVYNGTTWYQLD